MILKQAQGIAEALKADFAPLCERIEIGGSVRRRKPEPNDIELICIPKFAEIGTGQSALFGGETMITENLLFDHISEKYFVLKMGEKYCQIQIGDMDDIGIKVDVFTATPETWGYIFMLRTGSAEFSKWVVTRLKRRGYRLEGGAIKKGIDHKIVTMKEADVFDMLGILYIEPENLIIGDLAGDFVKIGGIRT